MLLCRQVPDAKYENGFPPARTSSPSGSEEWMATCADAKYEFGNDCNQSQIEASKKGDVLRADLLVDRLFKLLVIQDCSHLDVVHQTSQILSK